MGLPEVSAILWRERNLLDLLLFKLEEERLVLDAGLERWLQRAAREVELVRAELQQIEGPRAGALDGLAAELGLQPGVNLSELAASAPPPWDGLLEQHRAAFLAMMSEVGSLEGGHRDVLARRTGVLAWLDADDAMSPGPADGPPPGPPRPVLHVLPDDARAGGSEAARLSRGPPN